MKNFAFLVSLFAVVALNGCGTTSSTAEEKIFQERLAKIESSVADLERKHQELSKLADRKPQPGEWELLDALMLLIDSGLARIEALSLLKEARGSSDLQKLDQAEALVVKSEELLKSAERLLKKE